MLLEQEAVFNPSVDYKPHKKLEEEVYSYLCENDYIVFKSAYHDLFSNDVTDLIQNRYDPTSLYVRGWADSLALHRYKLETFFYDAKSHYNEKYRNLTIEILPWAYHRLHSYFGTKCLYVCSIKEYQFGFWCENLPKIKRIYIPPLEKNRLIKPILEEKIINKYFPDAKIFYKPVNGSGDPFLIIEEDDCDNFQHWKDLITQGGE